MSLMCEELVDHPFLSEWASWAQEGESERPYILRADEALKDLNSEAVCNYDSWDQYVRCEILGRPDDRRLHLGLLPQPFCGDLQKARVFILLLNPGLGPLGAFAQLRIPEYREALLANLRGGQPFMHLDPHFAWHGGFSYWNKKLRDVIEKLGEEWGESYASARERLRQQIATLELVPYHSVKFPRRRIMRADLKSAELAKSFARVLVDRAKQDECLLVVLRAHNLWGLPKGIEKETANVVVYSKSQARGAHLNCKSRGGKRIFEFLK